MDETGRPHLSAGSARRGASDLDCKRRCRHISLALSDGGVERTHCLFERSFRVGTVAVEDIHIIEPHALEGCIQAGKHIFARAPFAIGTGPHIVACFRGDDELIAIWMKILFEQCAEIFFGRAGRRTVVVGEVEMRDAEIEGATGDGASIFKDVAARRSCTTSQAKSAEV